MGADVDQRTAALVFFIQEHAPGGHAAATDSLRAGIIDLAQIAGFHALLQIQAFGPVAVLIADGQLLAGALGRVQHLLRFSRVNRHRLFTHNMLAGFQRINRNERMLLVGRQNMHDVDVIARNEFFVVSIDRRVFDAKFLRSLLRTLNDDVAESDHFYSLQLFQRGHMLVVCDAAAADNTNSNLIHVRFLPSESTHLYSIGHYVSIIQNTGTFANPKLTLYPPRFSALQFHL